MQADPVRDRILILAPTGRDSEVLRLVLMREGLHGTPCRGIAEIVAELDGEGSTGALLLAEEALRHDVGRLIDWVAQQPPWSDLPIVVLRSDLAEWQDRSSAVRAFAGLGNVALLERPLRAETLISAISSSLRARHRQYQVRAHLIEQQRAEARLRELNATLEERVAHALAEQRQAEAALAQSQKMEALGRLTGGVAHDFNNLLTAIVGNLELLQQRLDRDAAGQKLVAAAIRSTQRAARLTQQLLAFGRKQTLRLRPVDVNRVIAGMSEMLGRTLGTAARIETDLDAGLWPARVDEDQLVLVVLNLVLNARDALPGGGTVRIETANLEAAAQDRPGDLGDGEFVRMSVIDNGTGISEEVLGSVFEPFFTTKEPGRGSGLGLSQVYGLAKQLGGTVEILTRLGEGTEVRVYLPRARGAASSCERSDRPAAGRSDAAADGVVLVVDDDSDVRWVTAEYLGSIGFTVIEAEGGRAALRMLQGGRRVDLMVADFIMPEMDGIELLRRARELYPGLPALIVTAYARDNAIFDRVDVEVLRKPFHLAELGARVRRLTAPGGLR